VSEIATLERQGVEITPVSWEPQGDLDFEEWRTAGRKLGRIGRACQWWIGDWLNYGERTYGEKYTQALNDTGYDLQSLMNMAWVASRFDTSCRQEVLPWTYHESVAGTDPPQRDALLERAAQEGWDRKRLRSELDGPKNGTREQRQPSLTARITFEAEFPNEQLLRQTVATLHERAKELGFVECKV